MPHDMPVIEIEQPKTATRVSIPSLRANFAWTFAGNVLYAGCQWGMLSVLAKLGSPSLVGQFTLGLAVSAPIFMFTNLQLRAVQATDVTAEFSFADYFTLRLVATLLGFTVVLALLPFTGDSSAIRIVVLLVSVSKSFECMSDVTAGLLQREEKLKRVAISLMIRGSSSVLFFSLTFAYFRNLALSVATMSAVWLAVVLFYDLPNARMLIGRHASFFRFDRQALWRVAMLGFPLGLVSTFASLNANIPRYFLQHYLGLVDQGIYASLAYLVVVINLIVAALSVSVTTRLARLFADADLRQFVRLLTKLCMLGVLIAAVGVPLTFLAGRPLLTLLYRREYANNVGLLAMLVGTAGLTTVLAFLIGGLTAARRFRTQIPICLTSVVTVTVGSALLVPRYGLLGAGMSMMISAVAAVLSAMWAMHTVLAAELH